jgi:aminoacylase
MKCVGIQYLEAVRQLMSKGVQLRRTVHISFVPDEEIGGKYGMAKFVNTSDFLELNVGFALDEGTADPSDQFLLFYGERSVWQMLVHCPGTTGHGALLLPDTAGEKVRIIIDHFMDFREQEKKKLDSDPSLIISDVTSVNLTQLKGGVQSNVIPPEFVVGFDVRLAVTVDHVEFENMVNKWCSEAGPGIYVEFEQKDPKVEVTKLDSSNPWWLAFKSACDDMKLKLKPIIGAGATDIRYLRGVGLPALGFSPMNKTPKLAHDHDEFLNEDVFLKGIDIYCQIIPAIGNVAPPNK